MAFESSNRSNVLLTLGVLFTLGGATRFIPTGTAQAESQKPAEAVKHEVEDTHAADADASGSDSHATPAPTQERSPIAENGQVCVSEEMASLLQEDRWLFESEQQSLNEQKIALQEWQTKLETQTAELEALQATLEGRWKQMQAASEQDIQHLSQMYSAMKPDQAGSIFNQMDPAFAAGFLRQMSSDQAGLILANMGTDQAYAVSVKLATMNSDIREAASR